MKQKLAIVLIFTAVLAFAGSALAQNDSPIKDAEGIIRVVRNVGYWVSVIFWIVAGIAVLYAGFLFATASGSQEQVGKAKKQLIYAIVAIAIGVMAAGMPQLIKAILGAKAV